VTEFSQNNEVGTKSDDQQQKKDKQGCGALLVLLISGFSSNRAEKTLVAVTRSLTGLRRNWKI
jgi:hypothetical protein